jgi:hypothetical protein
MYESLERNCADFHLYIYAFDAKSEEVLNKLNLSKATIIGLKQFESPELLAVKKERTAAEYCWTCSASTIHYSITHFNLTNCTYIDADMQFFADPKILLDEMGDRSALITAHRYTSTYDQSAISGKYCVQFVTFKNDAKGMEILEWWRQSCLKWCFARVEDGKFGDQKYLDEFESRFGGVHELNHLGGGLAPWNIQQYEFVSYPHVKGREISSSKEFEPVFFHFHGLKFYEENILSLTGELYDITPNIIETFYVPYVKLLNDAKKRILIIDSSFNPHGSAGKASYRPLNFMVVLRFYLSGVKRSFGNVFGKGLRQRIRHHYYFYNDTRFHA